MRGLFIYLVIVFAGLVLITISTVIDCGHGTKRYTVSDISTYVRNYNDEERLFADISYVNDDDETETISVYSSDKEQDANSDTFQLPTTLRDKKAIYGYIDADFERQSDDKDDAVIEVVGNCTKVKIILPDDIYNKMFDEFCYSIEYTKIYSND